MSNNIVKTQDVLNSSMIKQLAYTEAGDLLVTFNRGIQYLYRGVPVEKYDEMIKAESVGKYLKSNIEKQYVFEKIEIQP